MKLWYLSHRRPVKVRPEPSLFAHMKYESRRRVNQKIRHHLAPLDAAPARLKKEVREDEKYHNHMTWLKCC